MKYMVKFINESADDANLIELTGSPKQIAWANDIRKSIVEFLLKDYSPESVYQIVNKIKALSYQMGDVFVDSFSTISQYPTVYYDLLSDIDDAFSIVYPPFGRTEPKFIWFIGL